MRVESDITIGGGSPRVNIGFVLEQTLGHRTHTQNLQAIVPGDPSVTARWALIPWEMHGLAAALPLFRSNWTVRAGLRARASIAAMTRAAPLDALFIHTQVAAVLATNWLERIPTIVSLDATPRQYDALGDYYRHARGSEWAEQQKWRLNVRCFRQARHLVTWTEWAKAGLVEDYGVPPEKVTVIAPGIRPSLWRRSQPRQSAARPLRILFVGGDFTRKGGSTLLAAVHELRDHFATQPAEAVLEIELHLVTRSAIDAGEGTFVYRDLAPNSQKLIQLFHDCDIFCLPTYGDCLPMVLSEAAAAGLPIVATNVGGIGEIVREGQNGFLIEPGRSDLLADRLLRLARDPELRRCMGAAGEEIARQNFDAERNATRLLELLKRIAAGEDVCASHGTLLPVSGG